MSAQTEDGAGVKKDTATTFTAWVALFVGFVSLLLSIFGGISLRDVADTNQYSLDQLLYLEADQHRAKLISPTAQRFLDIWCQKAQLLGYVKIAKTSDLCYEIDPKGKNLIEALGPGDVLGALDRSLRDNPKHTTADHLFQAPLVEINRRLYSYRKESGVENVTLELVIAILAGHLGWPIPEES